jgi:DHA1 family bicyclomycin/chloramphenicol resistance-like MFS transporter
MQIRFVLLLALLTAFPPLATDMYLPAIPHLMQIWGRPLSIINLTLILFFITYCVSLLFYGPLSDRFGRKPPLVSGLILFIAASLFCAVSSNVWMLVAARVVQGMGAGAASSISLAMARDRLESSVREKVLSQVSVIMALAPMISPSIGSLIIDYFSWQWVFVAQGIMGCVALAGVLATSESHGGEVGESLGELIPKYMQVFRNRSFMGVVFCNAMIALPLFAFIAGSSSIYINNFGLSEKQFALFFGANAFCFMAGSMTCMRFGQKIGTMAMISCGYSGIILGGFLMLVNGLDGPFRFAIPMGLTTYCLGLSRPPSNNLALEQVDRDAGTASSLMVFSYFMCGAFSMWIVSLDWEDKLVYIGALSIVSGIVAFGVWSVLKKHLKISRAVEELV